MNARTVTVTGWVDSTALHYEFGECSEALRVFSTEEDLLAATPCIGPGEFDCRAVQVTITYSVGESK